MHNRLTLVTAPASAALTLDDVKDFLRVDHADDDTEISNLITAAVDMIDGPDGIGYAMVSQTWRLDLDEFPTQIRIPLRPVTSVSSITYLDGDGASQTLSSAVYRTAISHGEAVIETAIGQAWPSTADLRNAVQVEFVAGTGVPDGLCRAMLLMIKDWYDPPENAGKNMAVEFALERYRSGFVAA